MRKEHFLAGLVAGAAVGYIFRDSLGQLKDAVVLGAAYAMAKERAKRALKLPDAVRTLGEDPTIRDCASPKALRELRGLQESAGQLYQRFNDLDLEEEDGFQRSGEGFLDAMRRRKETYNSIAEETERVGERIVALARDLGLLAA